jgi:hypothetical protein
VKLNVKHLTFFVLALFVAFAVAFVPAVPAFAECGDDAYEDDDTPLQANYISLGQSGWQTHNWPFNPSLPGTIYNDNDFVVFNVEAGYSYQLAADPSEYAQIRIVVFPSIYGWLTIADETADSPGDMVGVQFSVTRNSTYYAKFSNVSASDPNGCPSGVFELYRWPTGQ